MTNKNKASYFTSHLYKGLSGEEPTLKIDGVSIDDDKRTLLFFSGNTLVEKIVLPHENGAVDGSDGKDGREIELMTSNGSILWRYEGETKWKVLISSSDFASVSNAQVELSNEDGVLKWKYTNESDDKWRELANLSSVSEGINDNDTSDQSTWSSEKINSQINKAIEDYMNPFNATLTVSPSTAVRGSSVNVIVSWSYNKDQVSKQSLNSEPFSSGVRTKTFTNITSNTQFILKAYYNDQSISKVSNINFYNYIYYGVGEETSIIDGPFLSNMTKVLSDNKARTISVNPTDTQYIYYCVPTRLGECTFYVSGFEGGFEKMTIASIANDNNFTENFYIYRSTNIGLGSTSITIK